MVVSLRAQPLTPPVGEERRCEAHWRSARSLVGHIPQVCALLPTGVGSSPFTPHPWTDEGSAAPAAPAGTLRACCTAHARPCPLRRVPRLLPGLNGQFPVYSPD